MLLYSVTCLALVIFGAVYGRSTQNGLPIIIMKVEESMPMIRGLEDPSPCNIINNDEDEMRIFNPFPINEDDSLSSELKYREMRLEELVEKIRRLRGGPHFVEPFDNYYQKHHTLLRPMPLPPLPSLSFRMQLMALRRFVKNFVETFEESKRKTFLK